MSDWRDQASCQDSDPELFCELIDSCVDAMATADGMAERSGLNRAEHEFRGHWGA